MTAYVMMSRGLSSLESRWWPPAPHAQNLPVAAGPQVGREAGTASSLERKREGELGARRISPSPQSQDGREAWAEEGLRIRTSNGDGPCRQGGWRLLDAHLVQTWCSQDRARWPRGPLSLLLSHGTKGAQGTTLTAGPGELGAPRKGPCLTGLPPPVQPILLPGAPLSHPPPPCSSWLS